jgi:hypothetical protein
MLLDQEGFECDPINKREGDTPLHSAVRWANEVSEDQMEFASSLIEMMLEAGSDPRFVFSFLIDIRIHSLRLRDAMEVRTRLTLLGYTEYAIRLN